MLNLGTGELLVILLVALIVLGPAKLPSAARQMGRAVGELRRMSAGFQAELRDAMQEPVEMPPREERGVPDGAMSTRDDQDADRSLEQGGDQGADQGADRGDVHGEVRRPDAT